MLSQSYFPTSLPASCLDTVAYVPCLQNPPSHLKDYLSLFRRCVQGFFILPFWFLLSNCIKVVSCTTPACFLIPAPGPMSSSHTCGWAHHQLPGAPAVASQKSINFRAAICRTNTKIWLIVCLIQTESTTNTKIWQIDCLLQLGWPLWQKNSEM